VNNVDGLSNSERGLAQTALSLAEARVYGQGYKSIAAANKLSKLRAFARASGQFVFGEAALKSAFEVNKDYIKASFGDSPSKDLGFYLSQQYQDPYSVKSVADRLVGSSILSSIGLSSISNQEGQSGLIERGAAHLLDFASNPFQLGSSISNFFGGQYKGSGLVAGLDERSRRSKQSVVEDYARNYPKSYALYLQQHGLVDGDRRDLINGRSKPSTAVSIAPSPETLGFLSSLNSDLEILKDPANFARQGAYKRAQGKLASVGAFYKDPNKYIGLDGQKIANAAEVLDFVKNYPQKQKEINAAFTQNKYNLETQRFNALADVNFKTPSEQAYILGRIDDDESNYSEEVLNLKAIHDYYKNFGLAKGFIPNFAGYNRRSILGRNTRRARGIFGGRPKRLGSYSLLSNIIKNGNVEEARNMLL